MTLGGDHSIGLGTLAGSLQHNPDTVVLWVTTKFLRAHANFNSDCQYISWHWCFSHQVDAHADINTPASSTSGNMHGMPVLKIIDLIATKRLSFSPIGEFSSAKPQFRPDSMARSSSFPTKVHLLTSKIFYASCPCSFLNALSCWSPG